MVVSIEVQAGSEEDSMLGLFDRLSAESELSGALRLQTGPLEPGSLGAVVDTVAVALSSGAACTAAARVLVAWLRTRTSDVTVRITGRDGVVGEVRSRNVRALGPEAVESYVNSLATTINAQAKD
ncbi:hypothetical protein K1W54_14870 [Micromonospora sp. CPCC 205371]|nr:hypothetical protein [Micromonospora sp. CPCC 205371]